MRRAISAGVALLVVALVLLALQLRHAERRERELAEIEAAAGTDDLHLELERDDPTTWVRQYRPEASAGGYSLILFQRRVPTIIDMNGRLVHRWPGVRAVGRARLDREGRLTVIGTDNIIKEYDWDGRLRWYYRLAVAADFPHHDLIRLRNGNLLVCAREDATRTDYLQEVDRRGRVVWEWRSVEHAAAFAGWDRESSDPTHVNSLHELPPNRWFDDGDERFRPGNILVSARHLNTVFIIDKKSGEVVWQYSDGLDYQHEATMIARGDLGEGLILLFNNGRHDRNGYRRSLVQAIDPTAGTVEWEYGSRFFYSSVAGTSQKLPGENVAVTSSHGGRVFEVTPAGEIVWEWVPPYLPMRVERLPYDHCPQLAALPRPRELEVRLTGDTRPFIDIELYSFALPDDYLMREVHDAERRLLRGHNECRDLFLPPGAMVWAEWGLHEERLGSRRISARFRLTVETKGRSPVTLLDATMTEETDPKWQGRFLPLGSPGYRWVKMCVRTEAVGDMKEPLKLVAWGNPLITSPAQRAALGIDEKGLAIRERELRRRQLRALGYLQ